MAAEVSSEGMGSVDWRAVGPRECGHALAREAVKKGSVWGPSQAVQAEQLPHGGPRGLWHPGLWHILVSEVQGGGGGGEAEAVGAGAWDLGGAGGAEDAAVEAEDAGLGAGVGAGGVRPDGGFWDGAEGARDGEGAVVRVPEVEQEVGVWREEGEGTGGGVEGEGAEGGLDEGALAVARGLQEEAQAGCLEWRRLGSPGILPALTAS